MGNDESRHEVSKPRVTSRRLASPSYRTSTSADTGFPADSTWTMIRERHDNQSHMQTCADESSFTRRIIERKKNKRKKEKKWITACSTFIICSHVHRVPKSRSIWIAPPGAIPIVLLCAASSHPSLPLRRYAANNGNNNNWLLNGFSNTRRQIGLLLQHQYASTDAMSEC